MPTERNCPCPTCQRGPSSHSEVPQKSCGIEKRCHHHKNTTTPPPQKHHRANTKTTQPPHHKNTTTPPQKHHKTTTVSRSAGGRPWAQFPMGHIALVFAPAPSWSVCGLSNFPTSNTDWALRPGERGPQQTRQKAEALGPGPCQQLCLVLRAG